MSRLIMGAILFLSLALVAEMNRPKKSGRCCADPCHRAAAWQEEVSYCPIGDPDPARVDVR